MKRLYEWLLPMAGRYAYDDGREYATREERRRYKPKWYDRIAYWLVILL